MGSGGMAPTISRARGSMGVGSYGDTEIDNETLRYLGDSADLIRRAIEATKSAVNAQDYTLVVEGGGKPDRDADTFVSKPDPEGGVDWDAWTNQLIEETSVCDNLTIFPWLKNGLLARAQIVDGDCFEYLADEDGFPAPPAKAFRTQTKKRGVLQYTTEELWYRPKNLRVRTVRGFSPTAQVVGRATINMWKLIKDINRWYRGGFPGYIMTAPKDMGPEEADKWQEKMDDKLLNPVTENRVLVAPPSEAGGKIVKLDRPTIQKEEEELLVRTIFNAFGVDPTGMVQQVNYSTANALERWAALQGLWPMLYFIRSRINECLKARGHLTTTLDWKVRLDAEAIARRQEIFDGFSKGVYGWEEARDATGLPSSGPEVEKMHFFMPGTLAKVKPWEDKEDAPVIPAAPSPSGEPPPDTGGGTGEPGITPPPPPKSKEVVKAELRRYDKFLQKIVKKGGTPRPFESDVIPRAITFIVEKSLASGSFTSVGSTLRKWVEVNREAIRKESQVPDSAHPSLKKVQDKGMEVMKPFLSRVKAWVMDLATSKVQNTVAIPRGTFPDPTTEEWYSFVQWLEDGLQAGVEDCSAIIGSGGLADEVFKEFAEEFAGEMIGRRWNAAQAIWEDVPGSSRWNITETMRQDANALIQEGITENWSIGSLTAKVDEVFDEQARSLMIARTESANAYNAGSTMNAAAQGVEVEEVLDGGVGFTCECSEVNGQIWTIAVCLARPTAHPSCERAFLPRPDLAEEDADVV